MPNKIRLRENSMDFLLVRGRVRDAEVIEGVAAFLEALEF